MLCTGGQDIRMVRAARLTAIVGGLIVFLFMISPADAGSCFYYSPDVGYVCDGRLEPAVHQFEEPVLPDKIEQYAEIRRNVNIDISGGASEGLEAHEGRLPHTVHRPLVPALEAGHDRPNLGISLVGFLTDDEDLLHRQFSLEGYPVLGKVHEIEKVWREKDAVVLSLTSS